MAAQLDVVRRIAEQAAGTAGLVLDDLSLTAAGRRRVLRVVLDLPEDAVGGVPMDAVAQASQAISAALDEQDALGQTPYTLEVSSPGAERTLTERRHWRRARGRLVTVHLADGAVVEDRLTDTDDEGLLLDDAGRVPWSSVQRGQVRLDFGGGS